MPPRGCRTSTSPRGWTARPTASGDDDSASAPSAWTGWRIKRGRVARVVFPPQEVADLGGAGTLLVFAAGITLAGVGLGAADALPLRTHQSLDNMLVVALAAAAVGCALAASAVAAIILLAAGAGLLAVGAGTRWTRAVR